jgi:hypothetical protein
MGVLGEREGVEPDGEAVFAGGRVAREVAALLEPGEEAVEDTRGGAERGAELGERERPARGGERLDDIEPAVERGHGVGGGGFRAARGHADDRQHGTACFY